MFGGDRFIILIMVMVSHVCICPSSSNCIYRRHVQSFEYKLSLNKAVKKKTLRMHLRTLHFILKVWKS